MQFKTCQLSLVHPRCLAITFLLMALSFCLNAQTLHGRVYIAGTETAIANASVYYNASMVGTATNNSGDFTLTEKPDHIPLIVSCVGYSTATINDYDAKTLLKVYLTPKTQMLHDVVIGGSDGMSRKEKERIFLNEFLGTSAFAKGCTITNLKDVVLTYHQKTKTLTAACDTPLQIDNKPLGYHISYFLQEFTRNGLSTYFSGNYFYKDAFPSFRQNEVFKNRETAYKGSRLQFIRALWSGKYKEKGFDILILAAKNPIDTNIIRVVQGRKFIDLGNRRLRIFYGQSESVLSQNNPALITSTGYYGKGLSWSGDMSARRIGDNLPFEYWPDEDLDEKSPKTASASLSAKTALTWPAEATPLSDKVPGASTASLISPVQPSPATAPLLFEKTYLHTDRDVYAQGDTLWFKAYLVNGQDNKPVNSSGTLYVELLAPDSAKIVSREIIRLNNGLGNGDMALADTLKAGSYRLRAYTNWMRNFGDNFVFEKDITLLHTQAVPVAPDRKNIVKNKGKTKNKTTTTPAITTSIATPTIRFYPEGGSLVQGISSLVAVKAEDGYGKGIPASGAVLSFAGDTVSRFSCDSLGMGLLVLLPISGQSYHAVVDMARGVPNQVRHDIFDLPKALSKGLTLQIKQTDSVMHGVVTNSDVSSGGIMAIANRPATVTMAVKHSGKTLLSWQLGLREEQTTFKLSTVTLPEGISAITVYDSQGKPECERLVYIHHPDNKSTVRLTTNKRTYQPKEQVTININTQPNANLSMAVVDAGIIPVQPEDIVSYLQLQSEIRGNIEHPNRYFDTTNVNRFKQLDLLLMTQGWRDFVWRRLADTAIHISYAAENGISIPGRMWDGVRNKYLPDLNVSLFANGAKGNKMFSTRSDSAGRFHFDGLMLYGKQNIRLSSVDDKGKDKGTFLIDTVLPLAIKPHINRPAGLFNPVDSAVTSAVEKRVETMKASKLFGISKLKEVTIRDKKNIVTRNTNILTTFGYPDQIFNITPKDYQYKDLHWYVLQNIKGAVESTQSYAGVIPTGVEFFGVDTLKGKIVGRLMPPMIFVNDRELYMDEPTQAESYRIIYFSMPINKFKKIELRHMVGTLHGVNPMDQAYDPRTLKKTIPAEPNAIVDRYLLYLTMQDNYTNDNPGTLNADIAGYYQARNFYTSPPNAKPSMADYRTTIHWEPNIKTDATGKATISFYNTALNGNIRLIVQGVTNNGVPVATSAEYPVN